MKHLLLFFALLPMLLAPAASHAQTHQTDLQKANITGKVKSVSEHLKSAYDDRTILYLYNQQGNIVSETYSYKGKFSVKTVSEYDTRGFLVTRKDVDSAGKTLRKETFVNDARGHVLSATGNDVEAKTKWTATYKRDARGNVLEYLKKDALTGKMIEKTSYTYDSKGTVLSENNTTVYGPDSKSVNHTTSTPAYNAQGLIEKLEETFSSNFLDGTDYITTDYRYNAAGKVIYSRVVRLNIASYGSSERETVTTWDDNGNILKEEKTDDMDDVIIDTYTYQFDETGNWTKCVHITEYPATKSKEVVTERGVEYY